MSELLPFIISFGILLAVLCVGNLRLLATEADFGEFTFTSNVWCSFRASLDLFFPIWQVMKIALFGYSSEGNPTQVISVESYTNKEEFLEAMSKMYDGMNGDE